jgi:hypothetical protein
MNVYTSRSSLDRSLQFSYPIHCSTVLYIDPDPIGTLLMEEFFKLVHGGRTRLTTASTASRGLREAERLHPEVLMVAVNPPDMQAVELLTIIRADSTMDDVIVVSVGGDLPLLKSAEPQFDMHWPKPVDFIVIHEFLSRRFPSPGHRVIANPEHRGRSAGG